MLRLSFASLALALALAGCRGNSPSDPADVNAAQQETACPANQVLMSDGSCQAQGAQPSGSTAPANESTTAQAPVYSTTPRTARRSSYAGQAAPSYSSETAPGPQVSQYPDQRSAPQYHEAAPATDSDPYDTQNVYDNQSYQQDAYNDGYQQGYAQGVEANRPPPPLPVYAQPPCPGPGYMWNPGYWNYAPAGYYWVPGAWVVAPYTGALWTPGWWGFLGGLYRWHHGYWGPHIGFYGGVPYGYGYTGSGFHGGYWDHDRFMYNRAVTNVRITNITNTYNRTVINNVTVNRISYNGGNSGLNVRPTPSEFAAMREQHVRPLPAQVEHGNQARLNQAQYAQGNRGQPATLVAAHPLQLQHIAVASGVVNPGVRGETRPAPAAPVRLAPAAIHPAPAATHTMNEQPRPANSAGQPAPAATPHAGAPAMNGARPGSPVTTAHTNPVAVPSGGGVRPTIPANHGQPQPNHTQPAPAPARAAPGNQAARSAAPISAHTAPVPVRTAPSARHETAPANPTSAHPQAAAPQPQHPEQTRPQSQPRPQPQTQRVERPQAQPQHEAQRPQPQQQHVAQPQPQREAAPRVQEAPRPAPHAATPHTETPRAEPPHGDHNPHR